MSTKRISYTDSKGKVHLITEMGTIHISNAIKKLRLNNSEDIQLITALQNELDKRENKEDDNLPKVDLEGF